MPIDQELIDEIIENINNAQFIFIIGNGGAASQADHFACDLLKGAGKRAISLCNNFALISAIANDDAFENIFLTQLKVLFDFKRDILIALSASGKSKNVIAAAKYIFLNGGKVIAITGKSGGDLRYYATHLLRIESDDTQNCEDEFAKLCHSIYKELSYVK